MKLRDITEAKPTKTAEPLDWDTVFDEPEFADPTSKGQLAPAGSKGKVAGATKQAEKDPRKLKVGSAADTAKATSGIVSPDAMSKMSQINIPSDLYKDEPDIDAPAHGAVPDQTTDTSVPARVTADNVPAVISTAVADTLTQNPTWHQVKNLPGYVAKPIRAMGRQMFKNLTSTPLEDITVIANFGGSGQPNSKAEINAVSNWVVENGQLIDDDIQWDFGPTVPDYVADSKLYLAQGVRFLLVVDQYGKYIYAWPDADSQVTRIASK